MVKPSTVLNLTMPISSFGPVGSSQPWDLPHQREDIVTVERNRAHLFHIRIGSGTGTRLRSGGFGDPEGPSTARVPLDDLVDTELTVLRIPKGAGEAVEGVDVREALGAAGGIIEGSAVLLATGWGDDDRHRHPGEEYGRDAPYLAPGAAGELAAAVRDASAVIMLTDCPETDGGSDRHVQSEWGSLVPWLRPPWPSEQAKTYLRHYSAKKARDDRAAALTLTAVAPLVVGLVGCSRLPTDPAEHGARVTVLPMPVADVSEVPCTVVVTC